MSEKIVDGKYMVRHSKIIGTNTHTFTAWEEDQAFINETLYSTTTYENNTRYGLISSERGYVHNKQEREALARHLILEAFPAAAAATWDEVMHEMILEEV